VPPLIAICITSYIIALLISIYTIAKPLMQVRHHETQKVVVHCECIGCHDNDYGLIFYFNDDDPISISDVILVCVIMTMI